MHSLPANESVLRDDTASPAVQALHPAMDRIVTRMRGLRLPQSTFQQLPFRHLSTAVWPAAAGEVTGPCHGSTLWAARIPRDWADGETHGSSRPLVAGITWKWALIGPGIVAIADLCALVTNVTLIDAAGAALNESARWCAIGCCVGLLPWQDEVLHALDTRPGSQAAAQPLGLACAVAPR